MDTISLVVPAFVAGVVMFLAPCTLPLVPAFLAYITGGALPQRGHVVRQTAWFVLGFSVVFVLFGVLAGLLGQEFGGFKSMSSTVGGVLLMLFGAMTLGLFSLLTGGRGLPVPRWFAPGSAIGAVLVGASFAVGWTPCVGPMLASILFLAGASSTAGQGALLLAVFSVGLALPFLAVAWSYGSAQAWLGSHMRLLAGVRIVGGTLLMLIGALLVTDSFYKVINVGYTVVEFLGIGYQSIEQFL